MRFLTLFLVLGTICLIECMPEGAANCKKDCSGAEKKELCAADTLSDEFNPENFESECKLEMHNCEHGTKFKKLFWGSCSVEHYEDANPPAAPASA